MIKQGKFIFRDDPQENPDVQWQIDNALALEWAQGLPDGLVDLWLTSPPYLHQIDYGFDGQWGLEPTVKGYIWNMKMLAAELARTSTDAANLIVVIQDSVNGSGGTGSNKRRPDGSYRVKRIRGPREPDWPHQSPLGVPQRLWIALTDVGWWPYSWISWIKQDSRKHRPRGVSISHEEILVFVKSPLDHYWDRESVFTEFADPNQQPDEQGRPGAYLRDEWQIPSGRNPEVTVDGREIRGEACYPLLLADIAVNVASRPGDVVGDPFSGMGTTGLAAVRWGRNHIGCEGNPKYRLGSCERIRQAGFRDQETDDLCPAVSEQRLHDMLAELPMFAQGGQR